MFLKNSLFPQCFQQISFGVKHEKTSSCGVGVYLNMEVLSLVT